MTEETLLQILALTPLILLGAIVLYWLPKFMMAQRWKRHKAETVGQWEAAGVEFTRGPVGGQFGGLESMGEKKVIRGIGLVMLTEQDLRVTRATPSAAWCVTFKQIKGVTIQSTFLGKSSQRTPFIVVRFVKDGQSDRLAFKVKDYETWAKDLAKAARVSLKDQWNK